MEEKSTERLARYIIFAATLAIISFVCWYFKNVIIYILVASVVALIGKPLKKLIKKIHIKGKSAPEWLSATITLLIIFVLFLTLTTQIIPIVGNIAKDVSLTHLSSSVSPHPVAATNQYLIDKFPGLGEDFSITAIIGQQLKAIFSFSSLTSVIGSVASALASFGVALFSIMFIAFFFIKDETLFSKIIAAIVPEKHEEDAVIAIRDIEHLLSRYFTGLLIEVCGVALINFLGLAFVARLSYTASIGIAFLAGLLNIIPYVGPLTGGVIGTILGLVLKFGSTSSIGMDANFLGFTLILVSIFVFTQLIDNFIYQPVIYSSSIKASPLEIFIVLLIAGTIGGIVGMLVAIPCYTVIRVTAIKFFGNVKAIKRLAGATSDK